MGRRAPGRALAGRGTAAGPWVLMQALPGRRTAAGPLAPRRALAGRARRWQAVQAARRQHLPRHRQRAQVHLQRPQRCVKWGGQGGASGLWRARRWQAVGAACRQRQQRAQVQLQHPQRWVKRDGERRASGLHSAFLLSGFLKGRQVGRRGYGPDGQCLRLRANGEQACLCRLLSPATHPKQVRQPLPHMSH